MAPRSGPSVIRPDACAALARLWAPWRYAYITANRAERVGCIFCYARMTAPRRRQQLILHDNALALVMLNRFPYTNGHLMIAPRRHVASPELLERDERAMIDELIVHSIKALRETMRPVGFNLGANLGHAAGAGIAEHLHWHVVPRWEGDSNFMPVIGSARVLSQSLKSAFDLLAPRFKAIDITLS
jgi:ATP adenylyltransferase